MEEEEMVMEKTKKISKLQLQFGITLCNVVFDVVIDCYGIHVTSDHLGEGC